RALRRLARETTATAGGAGVSSARTVAVTGSGPPRSAGPVRSRRRGAISSRPAAPMSALPGGLGYHAQALDAGAPHLIHRLDDGAVGEPGVGLEVERLVRTVLERRAQGGVQRPRRDALVVQVQRVVLGQ